MICFTEQMDIVQNGSKKSTEKEDNFVKFWTI